MFSSFLGKTALAVSIDLRTNLTLKVRTQYSMLITVRIYVLKKFNAKNYSTCIIFTEFMKCILIYILHEIIYFLFFEDVLF
jgi:hypothetical protein